MHACSSGMLFPEYNRTVLHPFMDKGNNSATRFTETLSVMNPYQKQKCLYKPQTTPKFTLRAVCDHCE